MTELLGPGQCPPVLRLLDRPFLKAPAVFGGGTRPQSISMLHVRELYRYRFSEISAEAFVALIERGNGSVVWRVELTTPAYTATWRRAKHDTVLWYDHEGEYVAPAELEKLLRNGLERLRAVAGTEMERAERARTQASTAYQKAEEMWMARTQFCEGFAKAKKGGAV